MRVFKDMLFQVFNKKFVDENPEFVSIMELDLAARYVGKYRWFDYPSFS